MIDSNTKKTKYEEVYLTLRDEILYGRYKDSENLPSENYLCGIFNASKITIRRALSDLEKDGLILKQRGKPAGILSSKRLFRSPYLGRVGILTMELNDSIFDRVRNGIREELSNYTTEGIYRKFRPCVSEKRRQLEDFINMDVDGLIIEGEGTAMPCPNDDLYRILLERRVPLVFMNGYHENIPCGKVMVNDRETAASIMDYLYSLGHRKIGAIFHNTQRQALMRFQGYLDGLTKYGLDYDDSRVLFVSFADLDSLFDAYFTRFRKGILECTAFICFNDETASYFEVTLLRAGLSVPKDISIVGFDGVKPRTLVGSELTTAVYPCEDIGKSAVKMLVRMMETGTYAPDIILPMHLRIGNTTRQL